MQTQFSTSLDENVKQLNELLNIDKSFDLIYRVVDIAGRKACFYFIDGFARDEIMQKLLQHFYTLKEGSFPESAYEFSKKYIPYGEVDILKEKEKFLKMLLSGVPCLVIDGFDEILAIDFRTYPARNVDEPEKDRAMRGSRDGFVETLVFNCALIRRRIRSPQLAMEIFTVGSVSRTDVVVCYMGDKVDKKVLKEITGRIKNIKISSLTMNQQSLAECLYQHKWYNPFPKFKFTERPDVAAASVLEGNIVVLVDNSPSAMILPTSVFDIIEDADDYYFPPITGTYLRLSRFFIDLAALFLTPTFVLLMRHQEWIPEWLSFIIIKDEVNVPIVFQLLLLEFAIDGLRLASLNTPSMLSTPLSVVAGIVLGDFTVSSGWFNSEIMLYMAFVAIANYTQSNFELGYALKFMRVLSIILTGLFGGFGYVVGILITVVAIVSNKTISGHSYIYPLIPLDLKQLYKRFFRISLPESEQK